MTTATTSGPTGSVPQGQQSSSSLHHFPSMANESTTATGRRLFGQVLLLQDWGEEAADSTPRYWELFTDLLLVAAASSMADGFQSQQNWFGLLEFVLLYSAMVHGWLLYTHHYTSRFIESSLFHSAILFLYLLGMAATIVNASLETSKAFSVGILMQRGAFLVMLVQIIVGLPRAQWFASLLATIVVVSMLLFLVTALYGPPNEEHEEQEETLFSDTEGTAETDEDDTEELPWFTIVCWCAAMLVDFSTEFCMMVFLTRERLVPVNIDHSKDRIGVLVLVMMGETVISATISYRAHVERGIDHETNQKLYEVLVFSFLLVFMFTLLYFHVQPHPEDHAFRRSRVTGWLCLLLSKLLGMALLMVGVCIKVAVQTVAVGTTTTVFDQWLLTGAVGGSLILLLGLRCCHYLGRMPRPSHPPHVKILLWVWWAFMAVACLVPFFFGRLFPQYYNNHHPRSPLPPLAISSFWLLFVCVADSCFTHVLEAKHLLVTPEEDRECEPSSEQTALLSQDPNALTTPHNNTHMGQSSFYMGSQRS